jgi:hypothetical protein
MQRINVLSIARINAADRAKIKAVDPAIQLTDAGSCRAAKFGETWAAFVVTAAGGRPWFYFDEDIQDKRLMGAEMPKRIARNDGRAGQRGAIRSFFASPRLAR